MMKQRQNRDILVMHVYQIKKWSRQCYDIEADNKAQKCSFLHVIPGILKQKIIAYGSTVWYTYDIQ